MKRVALIAVLTLSCGEGVTTYDTGTTPSNSQTGNACSVQGNGNTVICAPATPTPTPSGAAACVPQTAAFVCSPGTPYFRAVLESVQATIPPAPEPIYVANLVKALQGHLGPDGKPDICAASGYPLPTDEIAIKAIVSNSVSETWDVVNSNGSPQSLYVHSCNPSRF